MSDIIATVFLIKLYFNEERKLTQQANSVGCMPKKPLFDHIIQVSNVLKIVEKVNLHNTSGLSLHGEFAIPLV